MDNVILYTSGCPHCKALEGNLNKKGISYKTVDITEDEDAFNMIEKAGFESAPVLDYNGTMYGFKDAMKLITKGGI